MADFKNYNGDIVESKLLVTPESDGLMSSKDKIKFDNIENEYLKLTGGTMTGLLKPEGGISTVGNGNYIVYPDNNYKMVNGTGFLRITLPVSWNNSFIRFKLTLMHLDDNTLSVYSISGNNNAKWYSTTAVCNGIGSLSNLPVSFGHDGEKCAISIGELNTKWNYVRVVISDIIVDRLEQTLTKDWKVSITTEQLSSVSATKNNTNINYSLSSVGKSGYISYPVDNTRYIWYGAIGRLKITLPQLSSNTLLKFKVSINNAENDTMVEYILSGWLNNGWSNTTAICLGKFNSTYSNLPVQFGKDTANGIIAIGNTDTKWGHVYISITDISLAYNNIDKSLWDKNWKIDINAEDLPTVNRTIVDTNVANGKHHGHATLPTVGKGGYIAYPEDGYGNVGGTGKLRITLPQYKSNTMIKFNVSIFNRVNDKSVDYIISGLNGSSWESTTAVCLCNGNNPLYNLPVSFGNNGENDIIEIGYNDTIWSGSSPYGLYTKIIITNILINNTNSEISKWNKGWKISLTTEDLPTVNRTITNTFIASTLPTVGKNNYIAYPEDGFYEFNAQGKLRITLPQYNSGTYIKFKVSIYNGNQQDTSVDYVLSGKTGSSWSNTSAFCIGKNNNTLANLPVSFGHDGEKCMVEIGTVDLWFSLAKINISDIVVGAGKSTVSYWNKGWKCAITTEDLPTINKTITDTNIANGKYHTHETLPKAVSNNYIAYPENGFKQLNSKGKLQIILPTYNSSAMIKFKVSIYNHSNNASVDYIVSGYLSNTSWLNTTAICLGNGKGTISNLPVTFGHNGENYIVEIGNTITTSWNIIMHISDIIVSKNISNFYNNWNFLISTEDIPNISKTILDTSIISNDIYKTGYIFRPDNCFLALNNATGRLEINLPECTTSSNDTIKFKVSIYSAGGSGTTCDYIVSGWRYFKGWLYSRAICVGRSDRNLNNLRVQFGFNEEGKYTISIGDVDTSWGGPIIVTITDVSGMLLDSNPYGWTIKFSTDPLSTVSQTYNNTNITYNSLSASKLATARTINGTNFDGTAAITTANWGTARTITIGKTAKSVNGSSNISWSLSEIGALPLTGGTLTGKIYLPSTGTTWLGGMTLTNASLGISTTNSGGSYHPIIACKTYGGHVWNLGTITNTVGIYGFKSDRTENATDWATTWDVTTGNMTCNKTITASGGFVGSLTGNASTANKLTTARNITIGDGSTKFDGSSDINISHESMQVGKAVRYTSIGGMQEGKTTDEFVEILQDLGAFDQAYWITRSTWDTTGNIYITDTGHGNLYLAGCVIEVISSMSSGSMWYTIRITSPYRTRMGSDHNGGDYVYIYNEGYYNEWRKLIDTEAGLEGFGITATADDLNYCYGLQENVQDQINALKAKLSDAEKTISEMLAKLKTAVFIKQ